MANDYARCPVCDTGEYYSEEEAKAEKVEARDFEISEGNLVTVAGVSFRSSFCPACGQRLRAKDNWKDTPVTIGSLWKIADFWLDIVYYFYVTKDSVVGVVEGWELEMTITGEFTKKHTDMSLFSESLENAREVLGEDKESILEKLRKAKEI